jgi:hypothetical protein
MRIAARRNLLSHTLDSNQSATGFMALPLQARRKRAAKGRIKPVL